MGKLLRATKDHPDGNIPNLKKTLWCGRCLCTKPVIRIFDCFGRVEIVFFSSVLPSVVRKWEQNPTLVTIVHLLGLSRFAVVNFLQFFFLHFTSKVTFDRDTESGTILILVYLEM